MYKINNKLAVHGFDWNWKTMNPVKMYEKEYDEDNYGYISNIKYSKTGQIFRGWTIVDCRLLSDDKESPIDLYDRLIDEGEHFLNNKLNVVCCCSAGQSRSSAIAIGLLVRHFGIDFYDAWDLVEERNPVCNIAPQHIQALKELFGVTLP